MTKNAIVEITSLVLLAGGLTLKAASGNWTGATDDTWAGANWSAAVPGTGDTATFNGPGNANTTIDLGGGVTILGLLFDTSSAAAYTIGNGAVGSQTLTLNDSGGITMSSTVANNELLNAALVLGLDATAKSYSIANNSGSTLTLAANITGGSTGVGATKTLTFGGPGNIVFGGNLNKGTPASGTANLAIAKIGSGTLTVNPAVNVGSASGSVTINDGTLTIDFVNAGANASLLSSFSPLIMGGGTLQINGNPANPSAQTFAGLTANAGADFISVVNNANLTLGAITRNNGGNLILSIPGTGSIVTSSGTASSLIDAKGMFVTDGSGNILDWAAQNAGKTAIVAGATVVTYINGPAGTGNVDVTGLTGTLDVNHGTTIGNTTTSGGINAIRFNTAGTYAVTPGSGKNMTGVNSILVTKNVGANNISLSGSGSFDRNDGNDLSVCQDNILGEIIWSGDSRFRGAGAIVKLGRGTVLGSVAQGFTGSFDVNGGVLGVSVNSFLGAVATGSAVNLNGGTLMGTATFALDNAGSNKRPINLLANGGGLAAQAGTTLTVSGVVGGAAGTGPLTIGIPASSANGNFAGLLPGTGGTASPGLAANTANTTPVYATGSVLLTGANTYTGGTILVSGTAQINGINNFGGGNYGGLTFNGGLLKYATAASGAGSLDLSSATAASSITLAAGGGTIDLNANSVTYANAIGNGGSGSLTVLDSAGGGSLTLSAAGTYTGTTTVGDGTHANSLTVNGTLASSGVTVASSGKLGGSGTIAGNVTVNSGGKTQPSVSSSATTTIGGNLTYNTGAQANFNLSSTYNGANDQVVLSGNSKTLTCGSVSIGINCGANLDLANDYVLFNLTGTSPTISGNFNATPIWLGTQPSGYANYQITRTATQVLLHYAGTTPPSISASSATPSTAVRNESVTLSVAAAGNGGATITGVSVNLTPISGSSATLSLSSGTAASGTWTGTITVPAGSALGAINLVATATDNNANTAAANIPLTINATTETWNGGDFGTSANWSDNGNWVSSLAPGLVGDTLVFDGATGLTPTMNNSYTVTGVSFPGTAGSFAIGASGGSTLTVTSGGVVNNSANAQTLNVPVFLTTAAQSLNAAAGDLTVGSTVDNGGNLLTVADGGFDTTISGAVSGNGGLTKTGAGTLTLAGANSFAGSTLVSGGGLTLNSGGTINYASGNPAAITVNNTGTLTVNPGATVTSGTTLTSQVIVGNTAGNAVLNISGGAVNANATAILPVGSVSGANGFIFMNGGNLNVAASELHIGNVAGSYGELDLSGSGTLTVPLTSGDGYIAVGVAGAGVLNMTGGMISNNAAYISLGNQGGGTGVANISGGLVVGNKGLHVGDRSTGILNVSGSANINLTGGQLAFGLSGQTSVGTANLLGGTVTASGVGKAGTSTAQLNFNGGTLKASAASAAFIGGLNGATIYGGGAVIDDGGFAITSTQPLLAPAGDGVSSIPVATGGTGYLSTPIVTISGGGGAGATAVATMAGGVVTGITITSPGTGYTSAPTVTLFGGGYATAATLSPATLAANTGGGLTKQGAGTLALTAANTYTGNTTINGGILALTGSGSIANSPTINVTGGTTFDVTGVTGGYVLGANQTLEGVGTVAGAVNASGIINPGVNGVGTLTFSGAVTLNATSTNAFNVTTAGGASNQVAVAGLLTVNSSVIQVTSGTALLPSTNTLFTFGSVAGTFSPTVQFDVAPVHAATIVNDTVGNTIKLVVPNTAPTAVDFALSATIGRPVTIPVATKYAADADGDPLTVTVGTAGHGMVSTDGTNITYTATDGTTDSFTYTVTDPYGASATHTVTVTIGGAGAGSNQLGSPQLLNGADVVTFLGIPNYKYALEWKTNLVDEPAWVPVVTNTAGANGYLNLTNPTPDLNNNYYRTRYVP